MSTKRSSSDALEDDQKCSLTNKRYTQKRQIIEEVENTTLWKNLLSHEVGEKFSLLDQEVRSPLHIDVITHLDTKLTRVSTTNKVKGSNDEKNKDTELDSARTVDKVNSPNNEETKTIKLNSAPVIIPNKTSTGLFGHTPYIPFELSPLKEKSQGSSDTILEAKDGSYEWLNHKDPNYNKLPSVEKFNTLQIFGVRAIWAAVSEITLKFTGFLSSHFKPSDYIDFNATSTIGTCLHAKGMLWDDDLAFGLQRFQGVNASQVRILSQTELPIELKDKFSTLSGQFLVLDYSKIRNYELKPNLKADLKVSTLAPRCILSLNNEGVITPEWIDLGNGITVLKDEAKDWLWRYAKLVIQAVEFNHHELVDHLTRCHLVTEIFAIETMRQWRHTNNIVYRLLVPHFARVLAANDGARDLLIPWIKDYLSILTGPSIDQLIADELKNFTYADLNFEAHLRKRGFHPQNLPSTYYYAQDGLQLWRALLSFNREVINTNSINWNEIQAWSKEIRVRLPTFPVINSLDMLAEVVTGIIFNSSIQHSAMNDPQWYFWGYVPNGPATLSKSPPNLEASRGFSNEDWKQLYFDSLPCKEAFDLQRDLVSILSLGSPDHSSLVEAIAEYKHFLDDNIVDGLQAALAQISLDINTRNIYTWLDPNKVTRSVIR
jgi:hypothetical protein